MADTDNLTQAFQLTSPVTEVAKRSPEVAQCSENEEQDESSEKRQLFNPSGEQSKQASVICVKFSAVKWKKVFALVVVLFDFFLVSTSLSLIGAFFTTEAKEKEASPLQIGIIVGITPFTLTVFSPCVGYLLPKLGFRFSLGVGLTIVGVSYLAIGPTIYLPSGWPFILVCFALRFIEGIGCSLYYTTAYTLATEIFPDSVGFVVGLIELGAGLGYAFGPAVGGYLYLAGGYPTPFIVVGGLCLICLIPSMLLISTTKKKRQLIRLKVLAKLLNSLILFLLLLSIILQMGALGFIITTIAIFYDEEFSLPPEKIGLAFMADSLCYVITAPISGKIADKTNPRVLVISGLFITGVGYFLLGPSSIFSFKPILWLTIIALCIIGIGSACGLVAAFPDVTAVALSIMESDPEDDINSLPGIIAGLISCAISFGEFIGPVAGGLFTQFMSFQESTSVYGEFYIALMFTIVGVTLIDKFQKFLKISKDKSLKVV